MYGCEYSNWYPSKGDWILNCKRDRAQRNYYLALEHWERTKQKESDNATDEHQDGANCGRNVLHRLPRQNV
jgi:hypothetical protein